MLLQEGTHILKEGEELTPESKFYVVQSGTVACFRMFEVITITTDCIACFVESLLRHSSLMQGETTLVKEIGNGGFFGEVALITKSATRAADCVALTRQAPFETQRLCPLSAPIVMYQVVYSANLYKQHAAGASCWQWAGMRLRG